MDNNRNKKIIVAYASAGIGHRKAAEAVHEALAIRGCSSKLIDVLDYTNLFFACTYTRSYIYLVSHLPWLWGFFYELFDNPILRGMVPPMRRITNALNAKRFEQFLLSEKPDIVVSSHFLPSEVVSHLKRAKQLETKLITVVTDYGLHDFWINEPTDYYVVGSDDTMADLCSRGVEEKKIKVMGIPILSKFSKRCNQREMREKLGLASERFTIFLIGGGFGVGPLEELARSLAEVKSPLQIVVVCGKNKEAFDELSRVLPELGIPAKLFGFVDNVHELMAASDVLLTKPGGLTFSEAFAMSLGSIIVRPIPGQETKNADFAIRHNAALRLEDIKKLPALIERLISEPDALACLSENAKKVGKPSAAMGVAELTLQSFTE